MFLIPTEKIDPSIFDVIFNVSKRFMKAVKKPSIYIFRSVTHWYNNVWAGFSYKRRLTERYGGGVR